jgi:ABC-2 type transport system permease protein
VRFFERQSMQMAGFGAGAPSVNINEQLIRPVFQYSMVVFLIVLPMITMRTYSEEKRSGTMELLLTSPVTDFQIIMGKFLGAMGLYASMLGVTLLHVALLYWVSSPEWMPIATSYLGLLLMGGCFMSVGLLISSFTKNQIVAVVATFAVFMMLWMINWIASFMGPTSQAILNYMSITGHLEDFMAGVIDTKHLVYYLSFIAFGLFLTARSVDTERWRG